MDSIDQVRAAYDRNPEHEWQRLEIRTQMRLEYLITRHALEHHLRWPKPGKLPWRRLTAKAL